MKIFSSSVTFTVLLFLCSCQDRASMDQKALEQKLITLERLATLENEKKLEANRSNIFKIEMEKSSLRSSLKILEARLFQRSQK